MKKDEHRSWYLCASVVIGAICVSNELTAHIMPCERGCAGIHYSKFNIQHSACGGCGGWRLAVGGWPLFFCGGHAFEFDLGVFFTCQVEPKGFVIHVGQDVNTFFPSLFAVVGFAGLDLGVVLAVAATLILVFVQRTHSDRL